MEKDYNLLSKNLKKVREFLKLSQNALAQQLNIAPAQYNTYERGTRKPSAEFFEKLVNVFNVNLNYLFTGQGDICISNQKKADAIEVVYYQNPELEDVIKNPVITSIWIDRELVHDVWHRKEKDLRIVKMPGENMNGNGKPIKNRDVLLVDTTANNIFCAGVYVYTTHDGSMLFVNDIIQTPDGKVIISNWNKKYPSITYEATQLKEVNFKVIGRVIKNLSSLV